MLLGIDASPDQEDHGGKKTEDCGPFEFCYGHEGFSFHRESGSGKSSLQNAIAEAVNDLEIGFIQGELIYVDA
jgi:hypothetical protein